MRAAHPERFESGLRIGFDHRSQRDGIHGEFVIVGNDANVVRADTGDAQTLLDAAVRLRRAVGDEFGGVAVDVHATGGATPASGENRRQGRLARRPLNDTAAVRRRAVEAFG